MGTRFRTMLAPIGLSTGDGRRFQVGGIELDATPFPFEWVRQREGGHDGAVGVGVVQEAAILTVKEAIAGEWVSKDAAKGLDAGMSAVWAKGEMFDGVDREEMPRLAEDVAESMHLMGAGTLGPSVDLDSFEGIPVIAGTDEEVTWERMEEIYEETGEDPKIELLITSARVRAATLVSIPAFAETPRPLELIVEEPPEGEAASDTAALIASVSTSLRPLVSVFDMPALSGPTPITWDWKTGRVFGHVATWQTCHIGYAGVCVTAPRDESGHYAAFNRFPVETGDAGVIWAGRITVGGRHPELSLTAAATMAQYDGKITAADVRAYGDEYGIVVSGSIRPDLDAATRSVLDRRKVSGDWRETAAGLSLVEILALSPGPRRHSEPGFPIPGTFSRAGRQVSLTAALGPEPGQEGLTFLTRGEIEIDVAALVDQALDRREERERKRDRAVEERAALEAQLAPVLRRAAEERAALAALMGAGTGE